MNYLSYRDLRLMDVANEWLMANQGRHGQWETKAGYCHAPNKNEDTFWRLEDCTVKMGQFCQMTGEYHWKPLVSCQSCAHCNNY